MSTIIVKQPVSVLNRKVNFDLKNFLKGITATSISTGIAIATCEPVAIASNVSKISASIASNISLENLEAEELAWVLIVKALMNSLEVQINKFQTLLQDIDESINTKDVAEQITNRINELEITLDSEFFNHPQRLPFLDNLQPILQDFLQQLGLNESQANAFYSQFKLEFISALDKEWGENSEKYQAIEKSLITPFTPLTKVEARASKYRLWLQQQANEPIFDEVFGLKQIYIPLRAYYSYTKEMDSNIADIDLEENDMNANFIQLNNDEETKIVCNLHNEMMTWLNNKDIEENLRVISGGPGSGKSSFAKILASDLAENTDIPVLFIPLHRFKLDGYLPKSIKDYLDSHSIVSQDNFIGVPNTLIIFDGLDELSMQGTNSKIVADEFISELRDELQAMQSANLNWKAIVTGRELSIQQQRSKLKKPKIVLHLLPYFINEEDRERFDDAERLLQEDQRQDWWHKFGKLRGKSFEGLPSELDTPNLEPITTEPLLNYLVALSYLKPDGIKFTEDTNLNEVYADLLDSVHERKYSSSQPHKGLNNIEKDNFIRLLEEIALTVWHESGRTASIDQIMKQCKKAGIAEYFDELKNDTEKGVVRLLMAFYFREFDGGQGEKTFEFTHKSFGEYLTARRIMLELDIICTELERNKKSGRGRYNIQKAFINWIEVCGPQRIDVYLAEFLKGEIQILAETANGKATIAQYQQLLIELVELAVDNKSPVKDLNLDSFKKDLVYSKNSEIALLELHSICAYQTGKVVTGYDYVEGFNDWLLRLSYTGSAKLNHLNLGGVVLRGTFMFCNFSYSMMSKSQILFSKLLLNEFVEANLAESSIYVTDLSGSNFKNANFKNTNLEDTNLENAKFVNAYLENTNFKNSNHKEAIFTGANLKGTILEDIYPSTETKEDDE